MKKLVKISDLVFDQEIYPRIRDQWQTAWRYAQSMKAGSEFPRILVGAFEDKLFIVDGVHRVNAKKLLKEEYIEANVKKYESKNDMFVDAVKCNIVHGRQLSSQERTRIITKLEDMEFSLQEISEIVKVPTDKIEKFKARIIIGPNGKPIFQKSVVAKIDADEKDKLSVDMAKFNVRSVHELLRQLIELLENNVFPLDDDEVKELTVKLYDLLQEKLQLAMAN